MNKSVNSLAHIRAVSFDLDDTLWDCEPVIIQAEHILYQWFEEFTPRICQSYTPDQIRANRVDFARRHPEYKSDVTYLRTESIKALLSEFDYPRELAAEAFACFFHARSQVTLYDDAIPVLEALKRRYKTAALTNGNADLGLIGIAHLFDDIQMATLTNTPKPHRTMFDNTATALGVELDQILHIGDNPTTDVGGGNAAGTMTVWFNQHNETWPQDLPEPDIEIQRLSTLIELLSA